MKIAPSILAADFANLASDIARVASDVELLHVDCMDGHYVPNLELAHHPFRGRKTYEDYVGRKALEKVGKKRWNKRVRRVIDQIIPVWNPRRLYVGGGNAKHLKGDLPEIVTVTSNIAGLMGGIALWHDQPTTRD